MGRKWGVKAYNICVYTHGLSLLTRSIIDTGKKEKVKENEIKQNEMRFELEELKCKFSFSFSVGSKNIIAWLCAHSRFPYIA